MPVTKLDRESLGDVSVVLNDSDNAFVLNDDL